MKYGMHRWLAVLAASGVGVVGARADSAIVTTAGVFRPHVTPEDHGRIDWTAGVILADGHGFGEGVNDQERLKAMRAAKLDAAANALAIAAGIKVDAHGRAGDLRNGRVMLEGCIKGHEIVSGTWHPERDPPEYEATLSVPLWGVKSVASTLVGQARMTAGWHLPLIAESVDVSDWVLVIDARGTGLSPCLFPEIVNPDGKVLYNNGTIEHRPGESTPAPAQYVETDLTFEKLQSRLDTDDMPLPGAVRRPRVMLAAYQQAEANDEGTKADRGKSTSQPASQPVKEERRRRRRTVRAVKAIGAEKTQLVLTEEEADKLRRDPKSASMLRNAKVVIVMDSAAAGVEGMLWPANVDDVLASAD